MKLDLAKIVDTVYRDMARHIGSGRVADYIPALSRVDPRKFGIAVLTQNGEAFVAGDADEAFSIQSVSKVFTLTMALERIGGALWRRVGREPTGSAFNSIVQLEQEDGIPRNPLINAGAIVVTDILLDRGDPRRTIDGIVGFLHRCADGADVTVDGEVARSEAESGHRNASLAHFMSAFGNLASPVDDVLSVYFQQYAIRMSCRELARAGLFLAHGGRDPRSGAQIVSAARARRINAIMLTCGHYDASGDFAFHVGLPGKSGVGGGILAIAPRQASIAVWSPGLNDVGNSLVGSLALERISELTGWSVF